MAVNGPTEHLPPPDVAVNPASFDSYAAPSHGSPTVAKLQPWSAGKAAVELIDGPAARAPEENSSVESAIKLTQTQ